MMKSNIQAIVLSAWSAALGLDDIDLADNFFDLGGHSLLLLDVLDRIEAATHVAVPIRAFFDDPTPQGLVAAVDSAALAANESA